MGKLMKEIVSGYWDNEGGIVLSVGSGLDRMKKEITEQQTELAAINAASEAQSATIAQLRQSLQQRDELIRIQGATCERYKQALEQIETNAYKGDMPPMGTDTWLLWRIGQVVVKALQEAHEQDASKEAAMQPEVTSGGFTGVASSIKKHITKQNEIMAIMLINGNECVAFPRTWVQYRNVLESGKELQIVAQDDYSRGYLQMIIQHAELLYSSENESETTE